MYFFKIQRNGTEPSVGVPVGLHAICVRCR